MQRYYGVIKTFNKHPSGRLRIFLFDGCGEESPTVDCSDKSEFLFCHQLGDTPVGHLFTVLQYSQPRGELWEFTPP